MPPQNAAQTRAHLPLELAATGERREYRARFIRAGRITRADGTPGPFTIPADAIINAIRRGLFTGLAAFVDHPDWFQNHSLRNLAGIITDAQAQAAPRGKTTRQSLYQSEFLGPPFHPRASQR